MYKIQRDLTSARKTCQLLPADGARNVRPTMSRGLKEIIKTAVILR
jgi:hypothetical protein